jgi:hypothetical protein
VLADDANAPALDVQRIDEDIPGRRQDDALALRYLALRFAKSTEAKLSLFPFTLRVRRKLGRGRVGRTGDSDNLIPATALYGVMEPLRKSPNSRISDKMLERCCSRLGWNQTKSSGILIYIRYNLIRAPFELSGSVVEGFDCSEFASQACASLAARVRNRGFPAVAFSEGLAFESCQVTRNGS